MSHKRPLATSNSLIIFAVFVPLKTELARTRRRPRSVSCTDLHGTALSHAIC